MFIKTHKTTKALSLHAEKITERHGKYKIEGMKIIYSFNDEKDLSARFFKITYSNNWRLSESVFVRADNHRKAMISIDKETKRVMNHRFREIEKTGKFYFVVEQNVKSGKSLIFEKY
jgi:hypothetical protein